jgi:rRNA-processing protein FCF1
MKKIVLDTNFLISLINFKIDLEEIGNLLPEPCELYTIEPVIRELKKINSKNAKTALRLIELKNIGVLETGEKSADNALINLADKNTIVATNDIALRKKLKSSGNKTIYLRAKKHLEMG